jgi:hypothetical protein
MIISFTTKYADDVISNSYANSSNTLFKFYKQDVIHVTLKKVKIF